MVIPITSCGGKNKNVIFPMDIGPSFFNPAMVYAYL
jgi:hypothetical protein